MIGPWLVVAWIVIFYPPPIFYRDAAGGIEGGGSGLGTRLCPKGQSQGARALGGARCSYSLSENEFRIPDYEPVTLFRSPAAVPVGDGWV
jgi:hypothetical protein